MPHPRRRHDTAATPAAAADPAIADDLTAVLAEVQMLRQQVARLEQRIEALESGEQAVNVCPDCGARAFRAQPTRPTANFEGMGLRLKTYACLSCGFAQEFRVGRLRRPKGETTAVRGGGDALT